MTSNELTKQPSAFSYPQEEQKQKVLENPYRQQMSLGNSLIIYGSLLTFVGILATVIFFTLGEKTKYFQELFNISPSWVPTLFGIAVFGIIVSLGIIAGIFLIQKGYLMNKQDKEIAEKFYVKENEQ